MNRRQFIQRAALGGATIAMAPRAFSNPETVRLDPDGMLRVKDRREFILGLYQTPKTDAALREAHDAGFDLVQCPPTRTAYDQARELGLRGWSALGTLPASNRAEAESRLRRTVEALRDHPALLFWETEDEPTFAWKEPNKVRTPAAPIVETAAFIRRLDSSHPLYLNHAPTNLVSTLRAYNPAADIIATDIYPVIPRGIREMYALWPDSRQGDLLNDTVSQVGQYADKMRAVAGPHRAVFMVLQAFAWENLREQDRDPSMILYPTLEQLRFMAWQCVAHGVNGLLWWGLSYTPPAAPVWNDLKTVARELARVRDALAAPALKLPLQLRYHDTGHSLERGIEWLAKPLGHGALLVAVNADPNPVDATFAGLSRFRDCELEVGSPTFAWTDGQLRERFEPFGTRVWRMR